MPAKKQPIGTKRGSAVRRRSRSVGVADGGLNFTALVDSIRQVHENCAAQANRAVNLSLTLRNWVIGWYVREYEQQGADRAKYGEALVERLAEALQAQGLNDMAPRTLRQCRQFYAAYPMIWQTASAESVARLLPASIWQSLSAKSETQQISHAASEAALCRSGGMRCGNCCQIAGLPAEAGNRRPH